MTDGPLSGAAADVIVVGAGAAGLTAAIALAQAGIEVVVLGPVDTRPTGRTVALLDGSVRFYRSLGLWAGLSASAAPLETIQLIDDTGSLFRPPPVAFRAAEIGLAAFGFNIENDALVGGLAAAARETPRLTLVEARVTGFEFGAAAAATAGGARFAAPLLVAADGRASSARAAAGIRMRQARGRQWALTTILAHRLAHEATSTEFHTRGGPFTLVPLPGRANAPHRSSLVWMMASADADRRAKLDDRALAGEIEAQAQSMLGEMRIEGARGRFPIASMAAERLTAPRLALIGEAAHVFPPIGAQGLNLGLRDVADLVGCMRSARARSQDLGGPGLLAAYAARRRADVVVRHAGVEALNRSLLAGALPVDLARGAGLLALATIGPLRRAVMRAGVAPAVAPARLLRDAVTDGIAALTSPHPRRGDRS